jgi:hypothetical protein
MGAEMAKGVVTLGVGMTVVFLVLGILYVMLLLLPMVNKIGGGK